MAFTLHDADLAPADAESGATATTLSFSPTSVVPVGVLAVLYAVADLVGGADETNSARASVSDSKGNTWTRAAEGVRGSGGPLLGGIYFSVIETQIETTDTITLTTDTAGIQRAVALAAWDIDAAGVEVAGKGYHVGLIGVGSPYSAAVSGLTNEEHLWVGQTAVLGAAMQRDAAYNVVTQGGGTSWGGSPRGTGGYLISTGTSEDYNSTNDTGGSRQTVAILVGFRELSGAVHALPRAAETDAARALTASKSVTLPRPATTEVARTLSVAKTIVLPRAAETDSARDLSVVVAAAAAPMVLPRRRHKPTIPRVHCRLDDRSIGLDDWLGTTIANGGCDTLRGLAAERAMRRYPSSFEQGAPIRLVLNNGRIIWEGELDANPLPYNGLVSLFARGPMVWAEDMQDSYEATGLNTTISRIFVDAAGQLGYDVRAIPLGPPGPRSSSPTVDNFVYLVSKGLLQGLPIGPESRRLIGGWTTPAILTSPLNILPFTWGEGGGANWAGMFDHLVDMIGWRWRVGGDHYGNGPVMDMGPWGPAHDARVRKNVVPNLSLSVAYSRVVVLYETELGGKLTVERTLDPDLDPLAHRGRRRRTYRFVLPNIQTDDTLASQIADVLMDEMGYPRPVGSLDLVGLSGDADETVFDAQGGDVITIGDLAPTGSLPLRIAQTEMSAEGVKAGIGQPATVMGRIALYEKNEANRPQGTIRRRMDVDSVAEAMLISEFKAR